MMTVQGRPGVSHGERAAGSGGLRSALSSAAAAVSLSVALCAAPPAALAIFNTGDPITNPQVQSCRPLDTVSPVTGTATGAGGTLGAATHLFASLAAAAWVVAVQVVEGLARRQLDGEADSDVGGRWCDRMQDALATVIASEKSLVALKSEIVDMSASCPAPTFSCDMSQLLKKASGRLSGASVCVSARPTSAAGTRTSAPLPSLTQGRWGVHCRR
jgi:hypothetical protein